jgi:hypothetical protein
LIRADDSRTGFTATAPSSIARPNMPDRQAFADFAALGPAALGDGPKGGNDTIDIGDASAGPWVTMNFEVAQALHKALGERLVGPLMG